jgi:hypothetical protein
MHDYHAPPTEIKARAVVYLHIIYGFSFLTLRFIVLTQCPFRCYTAKSHQKHRSVNQDRKRKSVYILLTQCHGRSCCDVPPACISTLFRSVHFLNRNWVFSSVQALIDHRFLRLWSKSPVMSSRLFISDSAPVLSLSTGHPRHHDPHSIHTNTFKSLKLLRLVHDTKQ